MSTNVALLNANNNFTGTTLQHNGNNVCDSSGNCNAEASKTANKIVAMGSTTGCTGTSPVASSNPNGADFVSTSCTSTQTVINNAIAALPASGGIVYLEDGTYIINGSINVPSNVTLEGAGSATVIELEDSDAASVNMISVSGSSPTRVIIRDIEINGNKANQSGAFYDNGIYVNAGAPGATIDKAQVLNVYAAASGDGGVNLAGGQDSLTNSSISGASFDGVVDGSSSPTTITNTTSNSNGAKGFDVDASSATLSNDIADSNSSAGFYSIIGSGDTFNNDTANSNSNYGIVVGKYSSVTGSTVASNTAGGIETWQSNDTISGNSIYNNTGGGIDEPVNGINNSIVSNNTIYIANGAYNGINVSGSHNDIADNTIVGNNSGSYGIDIGGAFYSAYNALSGNIFSGTFNKQILDNGNNTSWENQQTSNGDLALIQGSGAIVVGSSAQGSATLNVTGGYVSNQLTTPSWGSGSVSATGGSGTTWGYEVSALDGSGETVPSSQKTTSGGASLSASIYNSVEFPFEPGAVKYNIYRTTAGGTPNSTGLVTTITAGTLGATNGTVSTSLNMLVWKDTGFTATTTPPATNTTGGIDIAGALDASTASGTLTIGGSNSVTGAINIATGSTTGTVTIGSNSETGAIILGQSVDTNTIDIGSSIGNGSTQTINIGTSNTSGSATDIALGSSIGSSTTTIQGGTGLSAVDIESNGGFITIGGNNSSQFIDIGYGGSGANTVNIGDGNSNVDIESGSSNTYIRNTSPILGTVIQSASNSYSAFQIENASSLPVLNFDTTTNILTLGNITASAGNAIAGTLELADGTTDDFGTTLTTATLTANQTISLPNASGTLCLNSGNCSTAGSGYILNQLTTPGTAQVGNFNVNGTGLLSTLDATGGGTANTLTIGATATSAGAITIAGSATTGTVTMGGSSETGTVTLQAEGISQTLTGSATAPSEVIKTTTNSTAAFQVQNASGTSMFNINTNDVLINDNLTTNSPTGTFVNGASWVSGQYVELDNGGPGVDGEINYTETNVGNSFDATFDFWSLSGGSDGTWFYAYDTSTPSSYHFGNPNGGYDFAYSDQNSDVELYFNGSLLASAPISAPNNGTWHTAEITKAGNTMTMYYDGSSVLTYTDSVVRALTGTNFGLGGCSCSASGEHRATNFMLTSDASTMDTFSQFSAGINVGGQATASGVSVAADDNATGNALNVSDNGLTTGNAVNVTSTSATQTAGSLFNISDTATLTTNGGSISGSLINVSRSLQANVGGAGSETVASAVASFSNNCTLTSGTCTDATNVLSLNQQYANATGAVLSVQNAGTGDMIDIMNGSSVVVDKFANDGSLYIGQSGGSTTPSYLVLGSKTSSGDPSLLTDGAMYYNASLKSFRCQINGHWHACDGLASANTTPSNSITNTTTSTAFSGGNGSTYTIPANDCQPGVTYLITARGWYDTTGTPTITWGLNFGSTQLMATGAMPTMSNTVGEAGWKLDATLICDTTGTSGTVEAQGDVTQLTTSTSGLPGNGIDADTGMMSDTSAQTMNTTTSNTIKIYAKWSAASTSNVVELRQLVVQRLGPS